ncbi:MAG: repressor LexA [Chloroflexi bacterium]|nr:repressor LexA [Chloroflexota bacterium]
MRSLSAKQKLMLEFIRKFFEEKDRPPTIRDIQRGCNLSSTSVVEYNLRILEREGFLKRDRVVSRGIELLGGRKHVVRVPLIGQIAAGLPIPVPSSDTWNLAPSETIEVPEEMTRGKENVYALKVKGTSMIDALIDDGDVVLLQQVGTAEDGEVVAVWLKAENEATLKKIHREKNVIRLQPVNSQMKPIYVEPQNVEIQGRVIGVIRQLT